jgi:hypothetical protein
MPPGAMPPPDVPDASAADEASFAGKEPGDDPNDEFEEEVEPPDPGREDGPDAVELRCARAAGVVAAGGIAASARASRSTTSGFAAAATEGRAATAGAGAAGEVAAAAVSSPDAVNTVSVPARAGVGIRRPRGKRNKTMLRTPRRSASRTPSTLGGEPVTNLCASPVGVGKRRRGRRTKDAWTSYAHWLRSSWRPPASGCRAAGASLVVRSRLGPRSPTRGRGHARRSAERHSAAAIPVRAGARSPAPRAMPRARGRARSASASRARRSRP